MSVCYRSLGQTDRRTDLNFGMEVRWKDIYIKSGVIGQGHRSKVKGMRSKNVHWDVPLTSKSIVMMDLPKKKIRNTTWGVFKAYAVPLTVNWGFRGAKPIFLQLCYFLGPF